MSLKDELVKLVARWIEESVDAPIWDGNVHNVDLEHASQVRKILEAYPE